jgi:hypothetical protein
MASTHALDVRSHCLRPRNWLGLALLGAVLAHTASAQPAAKAPHCQGGICVEEPYVTLTPSDLQALKKLYQGDEHPGLAFTDVRLKVIILESAYLLTARKPNHYGVQLVVSKEGKQWTVLKKVRFVE